jgi:hypothetical protein
LILDDRKKIMAKYSTGIQKKVEKTITTCRSQNVSSESPMPA